MGCQAVKDQSILSC